jgi:quercetin dioxygenase-like cupin family protein
LVVKYPFQEVVSGNLRLRTFSRGVDEEELAWHRDARDRRVEVIQSSGWFFQMDDELPVELKTGDVLYVPKEAWHRIARAGKDDLVLKIEES